MAGEKSIDRWFNVDAGFLKDSTQAPNNTYQLRYWPLRFSNLRQDGTDNWDVSVIKSFRLRENARIQFRAEFLNVFNHANFKAPQMNPYARDFGQVIDTNTYARQIQLGAKFIF
jgi:hypothetical protein